MPQEQAELLILMITEAVTLATRSAGSCGSAGTRRPRVSRMLMFTNDDSWMPPPSITNTTNFRFVNCDLVGCPNTSAFSDYSAMTLRARYSTCINRTTQDMIRSRVASITMSSNTVYIFYVEVTNTGEIDRFSAVTDDGDHINLVPETSVRRNNSPIIRLPRGRRPSGRR
ncbi:hypothetical protein QBC47DRAFT_395809 [Echria macrotheca]|uniref:Uncharacterized protein n=1 Tax=Echria macrotheca TaxID=438768 RepID=A0AAJ0F3J1_9PEZI|nr:hypothetical protein QBC47DRAFT_395809 [Echria macrotheca]